MPVDSQDLMNRIDPITVLIAVKPGPFRKGIRPFLAEQEDIQVIAEAANVHQTLLLVEALHPNILLLDVQMPALGGVDILSAIHARSPTTKALLLSNRFEETIIIEALQQGAQGYLLKTTMSHDLARAIRALNAGELWAPRQILTQVVERLRRQVKALQVPPSAPRELLTNREREIVQGVLHGLANREIAASLGISEKTVKAHLSNIFRKLKVRRRIHLLRYSLI